MITLGILVQYENARSPMESRLSGSVREVRLLSLEKALAPIDLSELPSEIFVMDVQFLNAKSPILFTVLGKVI